MWCLNSVKYDLILGAITPKTNMAIKHPPFEDVFPIEHEDVPMSC